MERELHFIPSSFSLLNLQSVSFFSAQLVLISPRVDSIQFRFMQILPLFVPFKEDVEILKWAPTMDQPSIPIKR